jgi:SAM-dependent methyltransferase
MDDGRVLSRREAEAAYDRIGMWQDTQAFYEAPALREVAAHGGFEDARSIFEVGCGTGRFAERLLRDCCPSEAQYDGVDLSATMVQSARERLVPFEERASIRKTDGRLTFELADGARDRVVATYLLDLLSHDDARTLIREAHRLLSANGRLCLAGLTWGDSLVTRAVSACWDALQHRRPEWVGGCRPVRVRSLLEDEHWREVHHCVVSAWGVPSEVLVATPRGA